MTRNSCLAEQERGSAAFVVAHARWKRSRGRGPSMPYLTERNPRKALADAQMFLETHSLFSVLDDVLSLSLPFATPDQAKNMDEDTLKMHIRRIVFECDSETELERRLDEELGLDKPSIAWNVPSNATGVEARDLVKALGGLVSRNGAMVMVMVFATNGELINV